MLNGSKEFCQEFITDVRVPDTDRIGDVDDGWTVGTRWMFHERMLHNSPYVTSATGNAGSSRRSLHNVDVARDGGRIDDPVSRDLLGEAHMLELVGEVIQHRIAEGISTGTMSDQAAVGRPALLGYLDDRALTSIAFELAGASAAAWDESDGAAAEIGNDYLLRQVSTLGGGTTEMARNVVAERVLGMPRELSTTATPRSVTFPKAHPPSSQSETPVSWGFAHRCDLSAGDDRPRRRCRARRRAGCSRPAGRRAPGGRRPGPAAAARSRGSGAGPEAPIGSPLAMSPPSVFTGSRPPISVAPSASSCSCSPSAQKPFSAMWMTSAPASVSCSWTTSTSSGPMPAFSYAARGRVDGRAGVLLERQRRALHLERAVAPAAHSEARR